MKKSLIILSLVNIVFMAVFWWRFAVPIAKCTPAFIDNTDALSHFLASQGNHFSLIQIYLTLIALGLGALALWGYTELKRAAVERADSVINDKIPTIVKAWLEKQGKNVISQLIFDQKMEEPTNDATDQSHLSDSF